MGESMQKPAAAAYRTALTENDLQEVRRLEKEGAAAGIRYKIDPGTDGGIVLDVEGALAGFMTADCFDGKTVESAAIARDESDWSEMAAALVAFARGRAAERILFIADPHDQPVVRKLESIGLIPSFSEYRMTFEAAAFSPAAVRGVSLVQATESDRDFVAAMDREAFNGSPSDACDMGDTRIVVRDGRRVGKLRVGGAGGVLGIYGLVVEPCSRGQGIGAQAMTLILGELIGRGASQIYLEADSLNIHALRLYQRLGFVTASEFRYYPYDLSAQNRMHSPVASQS